MKIFSLLIIVCIITMSSCGSKIDFDPITPADSSSTSPNPNDTVTPPTIPNDTNSSDSTQYATDLIISELSIAINTDTNYGSVRNHYVEIYNGTDTSVELSNYLIGYQAVTDTATLSAWSFDNTTTLALTGSLAKNACYVIASPQADASAVPSNTTWGTTSTAAANASVPLQLSGNSAIVILRKNDTGSVIVSGVNYTVVDMFGNPNVARNTATGSSSSRNNIVWYMAGISDTRNRTFWRKTSVLNPNTNWTNSAGTTANSSEWTFSDSRAWSYSNVGIR